MDDVWTVKRTLAWCTAYLARHGDEHPRRSAQWLLSAATGLSRVELYTCFERPLKADERAHLRSSLRRRAAGEPLQYIAGESAFRHIVVKCVRGVFIPRPETELLVQVVLDWLVDSGYVLHPVDARVFAAHARTVLEAHCTAANSRADEVGCNAKASYSDQACALDTVTSAVARSDDMVSWEGAPADDAPRVLEVGCGTGCVALSLAREAGAQVTATDISDDAVACAKRNALACGLSTFVEIVRTDCADGIEGPYDALVSNPPYIPSGELAKLPAEVARFEPTRALDGGADGLQFFERLVAEALRLLRSGGLFACELFEGSLDEAARRLHDGGFRVVHIADDLAGCPRIISARLM